VNTGSWIAALVAILLLLVGIVLLRWPREVQRRVLEWNASFKWNPFLHFMKSDDYLINVRFCGAICIAMATTILWALGWG
jgi:hypothetical protein